MSKFYGTVTGDAAKSPATRRGHGYIKAAAQSYAGSIIVELGGDGDDPDVGIYVVPQSTATAAGGEPVFQGKLSQLIETAREGGVFENPLLT